MIRLLLGLIFWGALSVLVVSLLPVFRALAAAWAKKRGMR